jgi:SAM-dependent methyltransferase
MDFDYERDTREFYQDEATAQRYHDMFTSPSGWRNLPSRVVAQRERRAMRDLLARIPHRSALDIPAGTGKLADVFAALGTRVVASDISSSMLKRAEAEFSKAGHSQVDFRVADAADLGAFGDDAFDVVTCLRLMHRVPSSLRALMLQEFARVAPWAIVSYGIENGFHALRRRTRAAIFGGQKDTLCFCSFARACAELAPQFEIVAKTWIAPALSQEIIFLLRSRRHPARREG